MTPELGVSAAKTKELRGKLDKLGFTTGLIVVEAFDMKLWLAARNMPERRRARSAAHRSRELGRRRKARHHGRGI